MLLCLRAVARRFRPLHAVPLYLLAPCVTLWLLCQVFGALPQHGGFPVPTYLAFVAPALAVAAALPATLFVGLTILEDRDAGLLEQMLATPTATAPVFLAEVGAAATAGMAMAVVITVVGVLAGLRPSGGVVRGALAIVVLSVPLSLTCGGASLLLAILVPRRDTVRNAGTCILVGGLLCTTLFLPRGMLPGWLLAIAGINPIAAAIDGARVVCWPGSGWAQYGRDLLLLSVTATLSLSLAVLAIVRHPGTGLTPARP